MVFRCVKCCDSFNVQGASYEIMKCPSCNFQYEIDENYFKYDYDFLLYNNFKKKYLLNKVLNNNATLSYLYLKKESLSLSERPDVMRVKEYIQSYKPSGKILDVGCGTLDFPGYLPKDENLELFGLDPLDIKSKSFYRFVGCAEFMPFIDKSFDYIIYATSLDHVCSLKQALKETYRILKSDGKVVIWMSDRSQVKWKEFIKFVKGQKSPKFGDYDGCIKVGRYYIYSNKTVFYIPLGAADPFHSFNESPSHIKKMFRRSGFSLFNADYFNENEVFLTFVK